MYRCVLRQGERCHVSAVSEIMQIIERNVLQRKSVFAERISVFAKWSSGTLRVWSWAHYSFFEPLRPCIRIRHASHSRVFLPCLSCDELLSYSDKWSTEYLVLVQAQCGKNANVLRNYRADFFPGISLLSRLAFEEKRDPLQDSESHEKWGL